MKRYFLLSIGIVVMLLLAIPEQSEAQIYSQFSGVTLRTGVPYRSLDDYGVGTTMQAGSFALPPLFTPINRDDGYYQAIGLPLPFPYEYNGTVYNRVWVNVNGFVMFSNTTPPNVAPNYPLALFNSSASFPTNVVAPYWGDHYYRTTQDKFGGYIPSKIMWGVLNQPTPNEDKQILVIEWKDLNINDKTVQSSVGNFQVWIYQSTVEGSAQGDIEFAYGRVGSAQLPDTVGNLVITRGASIGIKGFTTLAGDTSDFLNGLEYDQESRIQRKSMRLTVEWPPSIGTDNRIRFIVNQRRNVKEWWGDGDADLTKAPGEKHENMNQNRFVTVNDARLIMRAMATHRPLDSVWQRNAYHGDVTHNGRYYYDNTGARQDIPWRDMYFSHNLPTEIDDSLRVFFQVTEYDASVILSYIAARVPVLPWVYDTIPRKGKVGVSQEPATGITFGTAKAVSENTYNIPIYVNGYLDGALAAKFDMNAEVIEVNGIGSDWEGSTVVIADNGEFNIGEPIGYVTVRTETPVLNVSSIRFNDNNIEPFRLNVETSEAGNEILMQNTPNPVVTNTYITLNIPQDGYYTLSVYDMFGNRVRTLAAANLKAGNPITFEWNARDESGNKLESGAYMYRLFGDNLSLAKKLVLSK